MSLDTGQDRNFLPLVDLINVDTKQEERDLTSQTTQSDSGTNSSLETETEASAETNAKTEPEQRRETNTESGAQTESDSTPDTDRDAKNETELDFDSPQDNSEVCQDDLFGRYLMGNLGENISPESEEGFYSFSDAFKDCDDNGISFESPADGFTITDKKGRVLTMRDGQIIKATDASGQTLELVDTTEHPNSQVWKSTRPGEVLYFRGELELTSEGGITLTNVEPAYDYKVPEPEPERRPEPQYRPEQNTIPEPDVRPRNTDDAVIPYPEVDERFAPENSNFESGDRLPFPERRPGSEIPGSRWFRETLGINPDAGRYQNGLTGVQRELAILEQIEAGNIPDFLRQPKKITMRDGSGNTLELSVMPDYLAIGTNEDWVRIPVTPILAQEIANRYGMSLPTEKVADEIYDRADRKVTATGMVSGARDQRHMTGNGFSFTHNQIINESTRGSSAGDLIAGHKKDIIVSRYAVNNPSKLDYYGFFRASGRAIQNAGGGAHDNTYVDYSHGVRFINDTVYLNGQPASYRAILANPQYAGLISNEGAYNSSNVYRNPKYDSFRAILNR